MIGRKRFWKQVSVEASGEGYAVALDARRIVTPDQQPLLVPTEGFALAIADEWERIEGEIRPDDLPFTRAANSAINRVAAAHDAVVDALAEYGETDLLCYRATDPAELILRQAERWDPWLGWARDTFDAPLIAVSGVVHHPQPPQSIGKLREAVADHDPFALTALHELVTLSGSLILGLAVSRGNLDGAQAWALSRIDEDWQTEQWGVDAEAQEQAARKRAHFLRAETLVALLKGR